MAIITQENQLKRMCEGKKITKVYCEGHVIYSAVPASFTWIYGWYATAGQTLTVKYSYTGSSGSKNTFDFYWYTPDNYGFSFSAESNWVETKGLSKLYLESPGTRYMEGLYYVGSGGGTFKVESDKGDIYKSSNQIAHNITINIPKGVTKIRIVASGGSNAYNARPYCRIYKAVFS